MRNLENRNQDGIITINKVNKSTIDNLTSDYQNLSSDGVVSLCRKNNSVFASVSEYHTIVFDIDEYVVGNINKFINDGLNWLVDTWGTYKSVKNNKTCWEVEVSSDTNKFNLTHDLVGEMLNLAFDKKYIRSGQGSNVYDIETPLNDVYITIEPLEDEDGVCICGCAVGNAVDSDIFVYDDEEDWECNLFTFMETYARVFGIAAEYYMNNFGFKWELLD